MIELIPWRLNGTDAIGSEQCLGAADWLDKFEAQPVSGSPIASGAPPPAVLPEGFCRGGGRAIHGHRRRANREGHVATFRVADLDGGKQVRFENDDVVIQGVAVPGYACVARSLPGTRWRSTTIRLWP